MRRLTESKCPRMGRTNGVSENEPPNTDVCTCCVEDQLCNCVPGSCVTLGLKYRTLPRGRCRTPVEHDLNGTPPQKKGQTMKDRRGAQGQTLGVPSPGETGGADTPVPSPTPLDA